MTGRAGLVVQGFAVRGIAAYHLEGHIIDVIIVIDQPKLEELGQLVQGRIIHVS